MEPKVNKVTWSDLLIGGPMTMLLMYAAIIGWSNSNRINQLELNWITQAQRCERAIEQCGQSGSGSPAWPNGPLRADDLCNRCGIMRVNVSNDRSPASWRSMHRHWSGGPWHDLGTTPCSEVP